MKPSNHSDSPNETYLFDSDVYFPPTLAACVFNDLLIDATDIAHDIDDVLDTCPQTNTVNDTDNSTVNTDTCPSIINTVIASESVEDNTSDKTIIHTIETRIDLYHTLVDTNNDQPTFPKLKLWSHIQMSSLMLKNASMLKILNLFH